MLKNISKLELAIGEKIYQFICDSDCPLNDVKEALFQILKYIGQIEDNIKAQRSNEIEKEPIDSPKEVE